MAVAVAATITITTPAMSYLTILLILSLTIPPLFAANADLTGTYSNSADPPLLKSCSQSNSPLTCQIEQMKHEVARLELLHEMTDLQLDTKSAYIATCEKRIEEMSHTIHQLESDLSNIEEAPPTTEYDEMINMLEEEVRELEAGVRRSDRELQMFKLRVEDAENWVNLLASQVKMMANIVPELWFHVQKLEQAHEVIKRRTAERRRYMRNQNCMFFKFTNKLLGSRCQEQVTDYTSKALDQLGKLFSAVKKYHHQLQGFVKEEMDKHELIAVLAGEELVFFLASAIFVFPIMLAWICCHHSGFN